jgi:hypothetical protein
MRLFSDEPLGDPGVLANMSYVSSPRRPAMPIRAGDESPIPRFQPATSPRRSRADAATESMPPGVFLDTSSRPARRRRVLSVSTDIQQVVTQTGGKGLVLVSRAGL